MNKIIFFLIAILIGTVIVASSGAFSSVSADREAELQIHGDASSQILLSPHNGANGDTYAHYGENGELVIELCTLVSEGVNINANIYCADVFDITNNSNNEISISCSWQGDNPNHISMSTNRDLDSSTSSSWRIASLACGETIIVSISVDTYGLTCDSELIDSISINASTISS